MKARRVNLLEAPKELTPRQRAQKKYRQTEKGKAASRRAQSTPKQRAASVARMDRWRDENRILVRVYDRVRRRRRKMREAPQ